MIFVGHTKAGHSVFRGKRPLSHSVLQAAGIKYRIDLQSGMFETMHGDVLEHELPHAFDIYLHDYDLSDVFPPTETQIQDILNDIEDADGDVFIHCLHGKDRTGFVCAAWNISRGMCFRNAVNDMFSKGFHKFPYIWWLIALYKISKATFA